MLAFIMSLFGWLCVAVGSVAWLPFFSDDMRLDLVGVIFFVGLGGLCLLVGGSIARKLPPEGQKSFILEPGDTKFIKAIFLRTRRIYLILGLSMLAFAALMSFMALQPDTGPPPAHPLPIYIMTGATLLLFIVMGTLCVYQSFKLRNPDTTRFYKVLTEMPDKVTGLTVHIYQKEGAPGTLGRQLMCEIHVSDESLRIATTLEQCSLLKQYIEHYNQLVTYREVEEYVP